MNLKGNNIKCRFKSFNNYSIWQHKLKQKQSELKVNKIFFIYRKILRKLGIHYRNYYNTNQYILNVS